MKKNLYWARDKEKYLAWQTAQRNTFNGRMRDMHHNAKTRAKMKDLVFDISLEYVKELFAVQEGKCAITGMELSMESGSRKKANPFRVSIDRVDSNKGYTEDNIQLVCWAVNQMKGDRTSEEFIFWVKLLAANL